MARIIHNDKIVSNDQFDRQDTEWIYNGLDCAVTLEILEELRKQLDPVTEKTYTFSRALQAPVMEMSIRGLLVNQSRRGEVLAKFRAQMAHLADVLNQIVSEGIGVQNFNWNSPHQLRHLFYDVMKIPPITKRAANGATVPTTNREALEKLAQRYVVAEPLCNIMLALRDLEKKRQLLETEIDKDGRFRTSLNIAGTSTGRLASSISDFGTGGNLQNIDRDLRSVFMADTGWKFCNLDLEQGDSRNVGAICWDLFRESRGEAFAGAYLDACESGDLHTFVATLGYPELAWTDDRKANRALADQVFYRNLTRRDLSKKLGHGCLTEDHLVLTRTGWVPISHKPSEIMCWSETGSKFEDVITWTEYQHEGRMVSLEGNSISFYGTPEHRIPFYPDALLRETTAEGVNKGRIPLGFGYKGGDVKVNARLVAAIMSDGELTGARTRFHFNKQRKKDRLIKLCNEASVDYTVHPDGRISINYQHVKKAGAYMLNWTKKCLEDFLDEYKYWDGYIGNTSVSLFSVDVEHLDWIQTLGRLLGIGGFLQKPVTSGFGSTVWKLQQNNREYASASSVRKGIKQDNVRVFCPTVPSTWFYVKRNGKIYVTGNSNYLGQPGTMAKHAHITTKAAEAFQKNYFGGFPCIPAWHEWVKAQLFEPGYITSHFGRRRFFFGRPEDGSTQREAVAYEPQSMTSDEIDTGILQIWRANRVQLLIQVHDSILVQYREEEEAEVVPWLLQTLRVPLILSGGREFCVPTEAKIGWNWGDHNTENPDGLIKWKGQDLRKRHEKESRLSFRSTLVGGS